MRLLRARARAAACVLVGHDPDPRSEGILYDDAGEPASISAICRRCRARVVARPADLPRPPA